MCFCTYHHFIWILEVQTKMVSLHSFFSQKKNKQTKQSRPKNQHTTTQQLVPSREQPTAIKKKVTKKQRFPRQSRVHTTFSLNICNYLSSDLLTQCNRNPELIIKQHATQKQKSENKFMYPSWENLFFLPPWKFVNWPQNPSFSFLPPVQYTRSALQSTLFPSSSKKHLP